MTSQSKPPPRWLHKISHYFVSTTISLMVNTTSRKQSTTAAPTTSRSGWTVKTSAAQRDTDQNRSEDAAKTAANKERRKKAASKKKQRQKNEAAAARKLKKSARAPAPTDDGQIVLIPRPKNNFRIQDAMDLGDTRKLFVELQSGVRALAIQAKVDVDLPWSEQDPAIVAKVLRVRYINSVRGYERGKANPDSGVNRRRQKLTNIGRREARVDVDETGRATPPAGAVDGLTSDDDDDVPADAAEYAPHARKPSRRCQCGGRCGSCAIPGSGARSKAECLVKWAATDVVGGGVQLAGVEVVGGVQPAGIQVVSSVEHDAAVDVEVVSGVPAAVVVGGRARVWNVTACTAEGGPKT
ncbi:hypothetical protein B0H15DRAFT_795547 [Mycena belliarum]|uniref:Uncharacterized protein n=1 Tax=Mycena belliarum TaxID=1033014 RepID=A0AAD6XW67_9AGAR|nr:hypothetical protein B0H15DRAFT_795547 [Mycena belliae]